MTRLFIDNQEITPPLDFSSLSQILKHVEDFHLRPNTVIREIQIDGTPLVVPTDEQKADYSFPIDRQEKVEISTGTITEIAQESIADALQYLKRVEAATPSLISSFQTSPSPEAFEGLKQLYEGLYWLNLLLAKLTTSFQLKIDDAPIQGIPVSEHHRKYISVLKNLIDSQQKRDFALIADLLEYEILPLVSVWSEMFGIVSDKVLATQ
jgi:hypothetical protein